MDWVSCEARAPAALAKLAAAHITAEVGEA